MTYQLGILSWQNKTVQVILLLRLCYILALLEALFPRHVQVTHKIWLRTWLGLLQLHLEHLSVLIWQHSKSVKEETADNCPRSFRDGSGTLGRSQSKTQVVPIGTGALPKIPADRIGVVETDIEPPPSGPRPAKGWLSGNAVCRGDDGTLPAMLHWHWSAGRSQDRTRKTLQARSRMARDSHLRCAPLCRLKGCSTGDPARSEHKDKPSLAPDFQGVLL